MLRTALAALFFLTLLAPSFSLADNDLAVLEAVVAANSQVQPGLQSYHATVDTTRIDEMMTRLTKGMPADVTPPPRPVIQKFWQRNGQGLVYASNTSLTPYVEKMVEQISSNLAIELNDMLLPADHAAMRIALVKQATIKTSEVSLADNLLHRLEITFSQPTDLGEAFYVTGMRLPQKQVTSLTFDIDAGMNTVNEMKLTTDSGLQLNLEVRYIEVTGGFIPERFQVTSPDGKIDDLFQVQFTEVDNYLLPASMHRTIRRPDLEEDLEVVFKDYQVNQAPPENVQKRLQAK